MKMIRARAPLRLGLAGGGTDVSPYCDERGGLVLNATINKFAYATIIPHEDHEINIRSLDYDVVAAFKVNQKVIFNGVLDLAKAVIARLHRNDRGFDLYTHSDAPPGSGLGSSSTMVVALVGAFNEWQNLGLDHYEIARLAWEIERRDVGIKGGKQDQYAATFGGVNFMEFEKDHVIVNPLRIKKEILNEFNYNLLICYTGSTRLSAKIIDSQVGNYVERRKTAVAAMDTIKELAVEMKRALVTGDLDSIGDILDRSWRAKKDMSERISNKRIDHLYSEIRKKGALGGKISGAGGGGFIMAYCRFDRRHRVAATMEELGGEVVDYQFVEAGLETWSR
jgi:D-glycero-alpha-D-manno-heptose-7-phosphate kinase